MAEIEARVLRRETTVGKELKMKAGVPKDLFLKDFKVEVHVRNVFMN